MGVENNDLRSNKGAGVAMEVWPNQYRHGKIINVYLPGELVKSTGDSELAALQHSAKFQ